METMKLCEVTISYRPKRAERPQILSSQSAAALRDVIFNLDTIAYQEQFFIVLLNRAARVIGYSLISTGVDNAALVDVKMIAQRAILANASNVILMHNHPSGTIRPSAQDDKLTSKIIEALKLFDIKVNDHIIVTPYDDNDYYSYCDHGKL